MRKLLSGGAGIVKAAKLVGVEVSAVQRIKPAMTVCVHRLEMSLFLPFRNVTVAGFGRRAGAEPVRSAAPARRPPYGP